MTVRDIKKRIFKFFRPIIKCPDINPNGLSEEEILEEEYKYFFENSSYRGENDNPLY